MTFILKWMSRRWYIFNQSYWLWPCSEECTPPPSSDSTFSYLIFVFVPLFSSPECPFTGELNKSIACQCRCTVNQLFRYSTSTQPQRWWTGSPQTVFLGAARLWASDVLTPPQWKDQLSGPRWAGFREKLSGLALTHVSVLAAAYKKNSSARTDHMRFKTPSCDTNNPSVW